MKYIVVGLALLAALCPLADAQAVETARYMPRHQITLQGSANFTRKVTDSGITFKPTSSGGGLVGYRFNITRWLGVEGEYDFFRNTQKFITSSSSTALRTNVHAATGEAVVNIPNPLTKRMSSYAFVGGGALLYDPCDTKLIDGQIRNVIVFGGGLDIPVARHIAIRGQAKTFMYKAPDFTMSNLRTNKYVQTMVPSAGLVFSF